ncbi:hypothetical protein AAG570_010347 [Ranatra chinensis]|uniref:RING-CH-type domain-containing protein n=1 Tax=Ranatra chinensis TaxID=642074 RepID=A0ABD0YMF1_9HEMI
MTSVVAPDVEENPSTGGSLHSISSCSCRICQTSKSREDLISPCNCKGTLGKVHLSCLERWLNMCGREYCELCHFQFSAHRSRRYGLFQSIRVWMRHPRHRSLLASDIVVGGILTLVTLGLCIVCAMGLKYFVLEGLKVGIPGFWTEGAITFFLSVIVLGYLATLYLMLRDHVIPWYRWWNRCMVIKLILVPEVDPPPRDLNDSRIV